jgi:DNA-binding NarL/FixJ family response regulator
MNSFLILEDNLDTAQYLKDIVLEIYPEAVIKTYTHLHEATRSTEENKFKLALVDLRLPDGNGLDLVKILKNKSPSTNVVIVTSYNSDDDIFSALSLGADGYVVKDEPRLTIACTLKRLENGEPPLSPSVAIRLMTHFRKKECDTSLSKREVETLQLLSQGLTVKEVAQELSLSHLTVAGYVKNIYQKLQVTNKASATLEAMKLGLIK